MKTEQIVIDVEVVKDWNWVKCMVKGGYYRVRNWWWGVSKVEFIRDCLFWAAAANLFWLKEYFLLGVLLSTYLVLIVARSVWNAIRIRQQYENRKFAKENLNMSFEELDRLIRAMKRNKS